jgi:HTH-type transcriptional regulator / antitoxin HigA
MDVRLIRTKRNYQAALKNAEALWDSRPGSKESDGLEVLTLLIQTYESEDYPIPDPDPIEMLLHVLESRALTRKDLEPYIGSRARVAEVLNRVRPLTLEMIRRLSEGLDIPADLLVRRYELIQAA